MTITPSHDELVEEVCDQVKAGKGKLLTVKKNHVPHTPRSVDYKKGCHPVDCSKLNRILDINTKEGWALVEGLVTLDQLVSTTLEFGLIPPVCPELRAFTIAGLINGRGLQSSSHKYGMFEHEDNITEVEVVLGDGSVVTCDRENNSDLFFHIKGCYGTLGFVTAAKIRLVPALKVVKSDHYVFDKLGEFCSFMESQLGKPHFLDGVVYSKAHAVAIVSDFVDEVPEGEELFHPLYPDPPGGMYYYQHVKVNTKGKKRFTDYIPTKEFIHRSERGLWWIQEAFISDDNIMSLRAARAFMDYETEKQYKTHGFSDQVLTKDEQRRTMIAQDQGFKLHRIEERLNWTLDNMGVVPIWVCYIKLDERRRAQKKWDGCTHFADIGLYGFPPNRNYKCQRDMRAWQLSADARAAWGDLYLTLEEADSNHAEFGPKLDALRRKYKAEGAFKKITDKISFYDEKEADLGGPLSFFRFKRVWRYSKMKALGMCVAIPLAKMGFLAINVLGVLLSPLLLPRKLLTKN